MVSFSFCIHPMNDGCYFLSQGKGVRTGTSFALKGMVFSTARSFDVLPCTGWVFFLSEEILL